MIWYIVIPLGVLISLTVATVLWSWRRPALGLQEGRLIPCPASPNCVCSFDTEPQHAIEPLAFEGQPEAAWTELESLLAETPRATVVAREEDYLRADFWTPVMHYVDDVEFLLDREAGVIHVRSASRVGHSDLGANRKRIEELRGRYTGS